MKIISFVDILFIVICGGILIMINELGYHHYIIIEILAGFFTGKNVARYGLGKKLKLFEGDISDVVQSIIIICIVLLIIELGFKNILTEFIIMFVFAAYFSGKIVENYVTKKQIRKNKNLESL